MRGASDQTHGKVRVDVVDFGLPNLDQRHVTNLQPLISLMKSNGCDLILHLANCGVTSGCACML